MGCVSYIKILNLFAGIGGNRTLWGDEHEITAVEHDQKIAMIYFRRFPKDKVIVEDAYKYLENHYQEFEFIWASPPCRTHTRMMAFPNMRKRLPDLRLYGLILFLDRFFKGYYVIENVISYYKPLINPVAIVDRHYIWANFSIQNKKFKKPRGNIKDLSKETLSEYLQVDLDLLTVAKLKNTRNHDPVRMVLRNCVVPEAGKYILESIYHKTSIEKWLK